MSTLTGRPLVKDSGSSAESGGVLIPALIVLVIAGSVSAGVATLVSSGAVTGTDRSDSERAFYVVDSMRALYRSSGEIECRPEDISGQEFGSDTGFECQPRENPDADDGCYREANAIMRGWAGGDSLESAEAVHQVCVTLGAGGGVPEEFRYDDPDDYDSGPAYFGDNVEVTGNYTFDDRVFFGDQGKIGGNVKVEGDLCMAEGGEVQNPTGALTANVDGDACFEDGIELHQNSQFGGDVYFRGSYTVGTSQAFNQGGIDGRAYLYQDPSLSSTNVGRLCTPSEIEDENSICYRGSADWCPASCADGYNDSGGETGRVWGYRR